MTENHSGRTKNQSRFAHLMGYFLSPPQCSAECLNNVSPLHSENASLKSEKNTFFQFDEERNHFKTNFILKKHICFPDLGQHKNKMPVMDICKVNLYFSSDWNCFGQKIKSKLNSLLKNAVFFSFFQKYVANETRTHVLQFLTNQVNSFHNISSYNIIIRKKNNSCSEIVTG